MCTNSPKKLTFLCSLGLQWGGGADASESCSAWFLLVLQVKDVEYHTDALRPQGPFWNKSVISFLFTWLSCLMSTEELPVAPILDDWELTTDALQESYIYNWEVGNDCLVTACGSAAAPFSRAVSHLSWKCVHPPHATLIGEARMGLLFTGQGQPPSGF